MTISERLDAVETPEPKKVNTKALGNLALRAGAPRILILDIETKPATLHGFDLRNQNFGLNQMTDPGGVFGVGNKWYTSTKKFFLSDFHNGHEEMVTGTWKLLDEADIVVTFNGRRFDLPKLNGEFMKLQLPPPTPYSQVDLFQELKRISSFISLKLDHFLDQFGLTRKEQHEGMGLWLGCMANDPKAWRKMRSYCLQDVCSTEELLDFVRPWIRHPHMGLLQDNDHLTCEKCGSDELEDTDKTIVLTTLRYPVLRCTQCGGVVRAIKPIGRVGATRSV